jgi:hypothetical protein
LVTWSIFWLSSTGVLTAQNNVGGEKCQPYRCCPVWTSNAYSFLDSVPSALYRLDIIASSGLNARPPGLT